MINCRCRTRVYSDIYGISTSVGRGNLSFTSINLPRLAIQVAIEDGYLVKNGDTYVFNSDREYNCRERIDKFITKLKDYADLVAQQLDERYKFQAQALAMQFPLLMRGMWMDSEKLKPKDTIESVMKHGTLGIGFIGLAEALTALTGKHHGESVESQTFGLQIVGTLNEKAKEWTARLKHNYSVIGTPAEGLSGRFTIKDAKDFGKIKGVTDREYYTNSNHVPVWFHCTPTRKAAIEGPYHKMTTGGHIFYVEADSDTTKNPEALESVVRIAISQDCGYISINHTQARCSVCNFEDNGDMDLKEGDVCPHCGSPAMNILQRVTGYLSGTLDQWTFGKLAEFRDRVNHM